MSMTAHSISVRALLLAAVCSLLLAGAIARNPVFRSESGLWAETVRRSPGKQRTHHNYGCALAKERRYEEALNAFDDALAMQPDGTLLLHYCYLEVGNAYYHLERYDDAVTAWRKALGYAPGNPEILTNIAVVLAKQGRHEEALSYARAALSATPPLAETLEVLGDIYLARGDVGEAAAYFIAAVEREPAPLTAYRSAAAALERSGDYDAASKYLVRYIARVGDSADKQDAIRALEDLRRRTNHSEQKDATR